MNKIMNYNKLSKKQLIGKLKYKEKERCYAWGNYFGKCEEMMTNDFKHYLQQKDLFNKLEEEEKKFKIPNMIKLEMKKLLDKSKSKIDCPICMEPIKVNKMKILMCGHKYCYDCIKEAIKIKKECPCCRKQIKFLGKPLKINIEDDDDTSEDEPILPR